jgi:hypothetical protein
VDWLLLPASVLTLRPASDLPEWDSVLGSQAAITLIQRATIIIRTAITGGRTTLIRNHIRITTVAPDTTGTTGVEPTTATIDTIITTTIELTSLSELWK